MKKFFMFFCLAFLINQVSAQDITANSQIEIVPLQDVSLKNLVNSYIDANRSKLYNLAYENNSIRFDFENLQVVNSDNRWTNIVTCKQLNGTSLDFTIGFCIDNNVVKSYFISKASSVNNVKKTVMFDEDFIELYTVNFDEVNASVSIVESVILQNKNASSGCGQSTMNCINHHYTNNGWTSVLLWTVTLFQPEVGLAVAIACGATCCLHIGCPGA